MTDADYYQAHKDDESEWGPPEKAPSSRRPGAVLSVRVDPTVTVMLREAAAKVGVTQSEYVRRLIWNATLPPRTWSCAHLTIGNTSWAQCGHGCDMTAA